eukprot:CAMPEP_0194750384 /NCGR_PEP_ID=MMETSP0323_2-20130528/4441_1 /TAXON_ID=2866 ORGANISM="Crypthecodinium cohnii, Strain Seligo" /NCGR_SAMPLE_ID=MMETSP0323_2 /ASSEMBLY_ACC=CAM_ASM_000346 /LENGTH=117 /DNA_ID=CAMNT_0039666045 /DNA_START=23 /DNA_END=373 /DNA_ORIENTATION=-
MACGQCASLNQGANKSKGQKEAKFPRTDRHGTNTHDNPKLGGEGKLIIQMITAADTTVGDNNGNNNNDNHNGNSSNNNVKSNSNNSNDNIIAWEGGSHLPRARNDVGKRGQGVSMGA